MELMPPATFTDPPIFFENSLAMGDPEWQGDLMRELATKTNEASPAPIDENKPAEINQAPNRLGVWSRSQKPRAQAMTGPRFEQTDFDLQVQPT